MRNKVYTQGSAKSSRDNRTKDIFLPHICILPCQNTLGNKQSNDNEYKRECCKDIRDKGLPPPFFWFSNGGYICLREVAWIVFVYRIHIGPFVGQYLVSNCLAIILAYSTTFQVFLY